MALHPGTRLGVYEVLAQIGEGGMGQVYRARDSKLNRDVALKVLPDSFANDPDRLARFIREAQTLASLNHPNIAHIHGLEESGGVRALVMELVEGDDLSQRIARAAIPIDEALPIAKQIAEALEAAHEEGIIHRDLKPANIKVKLDGTVKVLDFGLAKAMEPREGGRLHGVGERHIPGSQAPTVTTPAMTEMGVILGTAAYMAPEQARGHPVDKRADIWAFGCVFYEMLAGHLAFPGATVSDTIAAVLAREPDWSALPPDTPGFVTHLLKRCLQKDRTKRLRDIGDARMQVEEVMSGLSATLPPVSGLTSTERLDMRRHARSWSLGAGALAVATVLGYVGGTYIHSSTPDRRVQFGFVVDHSAYASQPRVSPDGSTIVHSATDSAGRRQLWLRRLDSETATPVRGTDDALYPFWSPDGLWIGFYAQSKLKKVPREGGSPQTLATLPGFDGTAAWSSTGEILYAPGNRTALYRMPDSGGTPLQVTTLDQSRGENSHRLIRFLPDGRHFLFTARSANRDNNALYSGSIDSVDIQRLFAIQSNVAYVPPGDGQEGILLFVLDGVLYRQEFDGVTLSGEPLQLMDVAYRAISMQGLFDVSMNGRVLISGLPSATTEHLTWFDREGRSAGTLGPPGEFEQPRISPEGGRVLFNRPDENGGNRDLWMIEIGRGVAGRLTTTPANEWGQFFTSDGRRVLFASDRDGHQGGSAWEKTSIDPGAGERPLEGLPDWANPQDITVDGRWIAFTNPATHGDIWIAPRFGDKKPFRFLDSGFDDRFPRFSPDGKWIAYHSNESGRFEVYVRPFSGAPAVSGEKKQISLQGGSFATWSRDGEELFYLGPDSKLYAAQMKGFGQSSSVPTPRPLFASCAGSAPTGSATQGSSFDVFPDGSRFLFACSDSTSVRYLVTVNWQGQP